MCTGRPSFLVVLGLQVVCRRFFTQSGLLREPPPRLEKELRSVLEQCTSSPHPIPHVNATVMTHLLHLLHSSLDNEQLSAQPGRV